MIKLHSPTQRIGATAEKYACRYLKKQGLKLVTQNFFTPFGEIDLIMRDKTILTFIEIRYRSQSRHGSSIETIDIHKQKKIIRSASYFLQFHPTWRACRFDVVAIQSSKPNTEINWIKDAFQVE